MPGRVITLYLRKELQGPLMRKTLQMGGSEIAYAAYLYVVEGLFRDGLIDEKTFTRCWLRFASLLRGEKVEDEPPSGEKLLTEERRLFKDVLEQWDDHPDERWRMMWARRAMDFRGRIPEADEIIRRVYGDEVWVDVECGEGEVCARDKREVQVEE